MAIFHSFNKNEILLENNQKEMFFIRMLVLLPILLLQDGPFHP